MKGAGYIEVIGGMAGILSSVSLFSQVARCWRRRGADDICFGWLAIILANVTVGFRLLTIAFIKLR